tara:strand:- start:2736 stop:3356 length:621 start_codon:yes stop_codon:yes gene_type:complete
MKKIKSIIFDLGAVLLNIDYNKTISEFNKIGIKNSNKFYSKENQNSLFDLLETGNISEKKFIHEVQNLCDVNDKKSIICAWNAMILDLPEKRLELIHKLKKKYRLYLLSNTNAIHIRYFIEKIGKEKYEYFYSAFNKVYFSHEISLRKPDKKSFELILLENSLLPTEVLFIDDSIQHIESANKLKINTHHLKNNEDVIDLFPDIIQ